MGASHSKKALLRRPGSDQGILLENSALHLLEEGILDKSSACSLNNYNVDQVDLSLVFNNSGALMDHGTLRDIERVSNILRGESTLALSRGDTDAHPPPPSSTGGADSEPLVVREHFASHDPGVVTYTPLSPTSTTAGVVGSVSIESCSEGGRLQKSLNTLAGGLAKETSRALFTDASEKEDWSFTLYDLEGRSNIVREDLAGVVQALCSKMGRESASIGKGVKIQLTVTPENNIIISQGAQSEHQENDRVILDQPSLGSVTDPSAAAVNSGENTDGLGCTTSGPAPNLTSSPGQSSNGLIQPLIQFDDEIVADREPDNGESPSPVTLETTVQSLPVPGESSSSTVNIHTRDGCLPPVGCSHGNSDDTFSPRSPKEVVDHSAEDESLGWACVSVASEDCCSNVATAGRPSPFSKHHYNRGNDCEVVSEDTTTSRDVIVNGDVVRRLHIDGKMGISAGVFVCRESAAAPVMLRRKDAKKRLSLQHTTDLAAGATSAGEKHRHSHYYGSRQSGDRGEAKALRIATASRDVEEDGRSGADALRYNHNHLAWLVEKNMLKNQQIQAEMGRQQYHPNGNWRRYPSDARRECSRTGDSVVAAHGPTPDDSSSSRDNAPPSYHLVKESSDSRFPLNRVPDKLHHDMHHDLPSASIRCNVSEVSAMRESSDLLGSKSGVVIGECPDRCCNRGVVLGNEPPLSDREDSVQSRARVGREGYETRSAVAGVYGGREPIAAFSSRVAPSGLRRSVSQPHQKYSHRRWARRNQSSERNGCATWQSGDLPRDLPPSVARVDYIRTPSQRDAAVSSACDNHCHNRNASVHREFAPPRQHRCGRYCDCREMDEQRKYVYEERPMHTQPIFPQKSQRMARGLSHPLHHFQHHEEVVVDAFHGEPMSLYQQAESRLDGYETSLSVGSTRDLQQRDEKVRSWINDNIRGSVLPEECLPESTAAEAGTIHHRSQHNHTHQTVSGTRNSLAAGSSSLVGAKESNRITVPEVVGSPEGAGKRGGKSHRNGGRRRKKAHHSGGNAAAVGAAMAASSAPSRGNGRENGHQGSGKEVIVHRHHHVHEHHHHYHFDPSASSQ